MRTILALILLLLPACDMPSGSAGEGKWRISNLGGW